LNYLKGLIIILKKNNNLNSTNDGYINLKTDGNVLYIFDENESAGFRVIRYYEKELSFNDRS